MGFKAPKITIDPTALKHGVWGNSWKEWGWILLAFGVLYGILTGYLTGLLFAARGIRQDNFRGISGKYFGDFDRQLFNTTVDILPYTGGTRSPSFFNRPDGCTPLTDPVSLPGFPGESIPEQPNGILYCSVASEQWRWAVYPWVIETNGLGQYPGCATAGDGEATNPGSYLSNENPAGQDAANSTAATREQYVCQNNLNNAAFAQ